VRDVVIWGPWPEDTWPQSGRRSSVGFPFLIKKTCTFERQKDPKIRPHRPLSKAIPSDSISAPIKAVASLPNPSALLIRKTCPLETPHYPEPDPTVRLRKLFLPIRCAFRADPFTTPDSLTRRLRSHPRHGNSISRGFLSFRSTVWSSANKSALLVGYPSVSGAWTMG